jgi:NifU-like protein involved in Fe-S cluster formation
MDVKISEEKLEKIIDVVVNGIGVGTAFMSAVANVEILVNKTIRVSHSKKR